VENGIHFYENVLADLVRLLQSACRGGQSGFLVMHPVLVSMHQVQSIPEKKAFQTGLTFSTSSKSLI